MLNLLRSLLEIVTNVIEFVISFIVSLTTLLLNIPKYLSFLTNNITTLPNIVIPFATASISLYIVYLILGRNRS